MGKRDQSAAVTATWIQGKPVEMVRTIDGPVTWATEVTSGLIPSILGVGGWENRAKMYKDQVLTPGGYFYEEARKCGEEKMVFQEQWLNVVSSALRYITSVDAKDEVDQLVDSRKRMDVGLEANFNMVGFFMRLGEERGMVDALPEVFNGMVIDSKLGELVDSRGMRRMLSGWAGAIAGYCLLKKSYPDGKFEVAPPRLDKKGVDFIWVDGKCKRFLQLKAGRGLETVLLDLGREENRVRFTKDHVDDKRTLATYRNLLRVSQENGAIPVWMSIKM